MARIDYIARTKAAHEDPHLGTATLDYDEMYDTGWHGCRWCGVELVSNFEAKGQHVHVGTESPYCAHQ